MANKKHKETIIDKKGRKITYKLKENWKKDTWQPTKYSEKMVVKLEELFEIDCNVKEACSQVGIHPDTYYEWLKRYPDFAERMEKAKEWSLVYVKQRHVELMHSKNEKIASIHILEHLKNRSADWKTKQEIKVEWNIQQEINEEDKEILQSIADRLWLDWKMFAQ